LLRLEPAPRQAWQLLPFAPYRRQPLTGQVMNAGSS
jgi:hypothetical protein